MKSAFRPRPAKVADVKCRISLAAHKFAENFRSRDFAITSDLRVTRWDIAAFISHE